MAVSKFQAALLALLYFCCALTASFAAELESSPAPLRRTPPKSPSEALKSFVIREGFVIELAACEPNVVDPIALAFDEEGRLWVVEMRDYSERRDERLGRIRLLEDLDDDGFFEKSTIFLENLAWPTAVFPYAGGVFIGSTPDILYARDNDADGKSDSVEVIFTGFASLSPRLNVQQLLNSFQWGLDNRIHGATGGNPSQVSRPGHDRPVRLQNRDFSFDPASLAFFPESGGAQHGLTFDSYGRKFVCSNSSHILAVMYEDRFAHLAQFYLAPSPLVEAAADGGAAPVYRLSPEEPWRVLRTSLRVAGMVPGPIEGGGRASGYFTSATGVTIYRGDAFPAEYAGDCFVADCGSNLLHRKKLDYSKLEPIARRAHDEEKREFLASSDNWFRPVQMANGPDGCLYLADMYREVIEHPWSLPERIKSQLDLNSGNDRGRIYRILPKNHVRRKTPRLGKWPASELAALLDHANAWHRETAARLLFTRGASSESTIAKVREVLNTGSTAGRLQALYTLRGLGALRLTDLQKAMNDSEPLLKQHALRLGAVPSANLVDDPSIHVRYQLALELGRLPTTQAAPLLRRLALRDASDSWMRHALLMSAAAQPQSFFKDFLSELSARESANPGLELFAQECARILARKLSHSEQKAAFKVSPSRTGFLVAHAFLDESDKRQPPRPALAHRDELFQEARRIVKDDASKATHRAAAMQLLLSGNPDQEVELFLSLFFGSYPTELKEKSIQILSRAKSPLLFNKLLERWPEIEISDRRKIIGAALESNRTWVFQQLKDQRLVLSDFSLPQLRELQARPEAATLQISFSRESKEDLLNRFRPAMNLRGNSEEGKTIFMERCQSCHQYKGLGQAIGPDLRSVLANGKEIMLQSIVDPNREIAPRFLSYEVKLKSGESKDGLLINDLPLVVALRTASGNVETIPRSEIQEMILSGRSLMPEGLIDDLSPQQAANLLEFILSAP